MVNVASIWHTALERLDTHPVDAVCKGWLQAARLTQAPSADVDELSAPLPAGTEVLYLLLNVPNELGRDMLNTRWRPTIEDILVDITEQAVS
ncbi:MAG TPA: hypothetical protein VGM01_15245, partial [Ktedonobacteraceae bacterium]